MLLVNRLMKLLDEFLKPYKTSRGRKKYILRCGSQCPLWEKRGFLEGGKGDVMIPSAHIFEGTADNYPFKNELSKNDFEGCKAWMCMKAL
jgi:hypothetical protein